MPLEPGTPAPDFGLLSHTREPVGLHDLKGGKSMLVFMPFPFTRICTAEACSIRDNLASLNDVGARVAMITTHALSTNAEWARQNDFTFDILADYWPHGRVSAVYDAFDKEIGYSKRVTYFLDPEGVIREVIASEFREARDNESYTSILQRI